MLLRQALRVKGICVAWPTMAMADVPDCFASIAASRASAFWRRPHTFVSPWPLQPGGPGNGPRRVVTPTSTSRVLSEADRGFTVDLTADLSWCRPDPASRLTSHGRG